MAAYLFHWNPDVDPISTEPLEEAARRGTAFRSPWRCADGAASPGDDAFLIRTGDASRGLFGRGVITQAPFVDGRTQYVRLELPVVLGWKDVLPRGRLDLAPFDRYAKEVWSSRKTGVRVPAEIVAALDHLWEDHLREVRSRRPKPVVSSVATFDGTADPVELAEQVRALLRANRIERPRGEMTPKRVEASSSRYLRRADVVAWVLKEARGACELCQRPAPFNDAHSSPFLECHHVKTLAELGPDVIENAVAVCPNCHRALHHAGDREDRASQLFARVKRLRRF